MHESDPFDQNAGLDYRLDSEQNEMRDLPTIAFPTAVVRPKSGNQDARCLVLQFCMLYIGRGGGSFGTS